MEDDEKPSESREEVSEDVESLKLNRNIVLLSNS
jgi:hypothetical protein